MAQTPEERERLTRLAAELRREPGPLIPLPEQEEDEYGLLPRRGQGRMPGAHHSSSGQSSTSYQLDTTSGMDEAIKRADALGEAVAQRSAAMYGRGGELDMAGALSASDRIRFLRGYLRGVSPEVTDSNPYPFAVPMVRLGGVNSSSGSHSGGVHMEH